jgi:hypothetical protein
LNKFPLDVIPWRLPVLFQFPNVLSLKKRNLVSALTVEKVEN